MGSLSQNLWLYLPLTNILVSLSHRRRLMRLSADDICSLLNAYGFTASLRPSQYGCKGTPSNALTELSHRLCWMLSYCSTIHLAVKSHKYTIYLHRSREMQNKLLCNRPTHILQRGLKPFKHIMRVSAQQFLEKENVTSEHLSGSKNI